jgi:predicted metallo-beta-lactamase superfamily hydrolase
MDALKAGDKFLLPVTYEKMGVTSQFFLTQSGYHVLFDLPEIATLIPANRLTDLEAENARLRGALELIAKVAKDDVVVVDIAEVALNTGDNQ